MIFTKVFIAKMFSRRVPAAKNGENFATALTNTFISLNSRRARR
jgi:hypothetical protein